MKNLFDIKGFRATCVLSISRLINNIYLLRKRPKEKNMRRDYDDIIEYPMTYSIIIWKRCLYFLWHMNWHHHNLNTSMEAPRCNCLGIPSYLLLDFDAKNHFTKNYSWDSSFMKTILRIYNSSYHFVPAAAKVIKLCTF